MNLFWYPERPSDGSTELSLLQTLSAKGMLTEPFERALIGLKEVYPDKGK
jgi:hypothetical protein